MLRTHLQRAAAALALGLGAATTLPAQTAASADSSATACMGRQMMHPADTASHGGMMSMGGAPGVQQGMGGMMGMGSTSAAPGMMGMGTSPHMMGASAGHMTQMLGMMEQRLARIQALMKDSTVAQDSLTMRSLGLMQQHMAAMFTAMGPMIGRMERMQQPDTTHTRTP
jgi:hypothetical protein